MYSLAVSGALPACVWPLWVVVANMLAYLASLVSQCPARCCPLYRIRAAHCLTSVQFSPTCDHLLLAYGKKHISLLRSLVAERGVVVPLHTILEVFRCGCGRPSGD